MTSVSEDLGGGWSGVWSWTVDRVPAGQALDTRPGEITFRERRASPSPRFRAYHSAGDATAGQTLAAGLNPGDVITDVQVILIFCGVTSGHSRARPWPRPMSLQR